MSIENKKNKKHHLSFHKNKNTYKKNNITPVQHFTIKMQLTKVTITAAIVLGTNDATAFTVAPRSSLSVSSLASKSMYMPSSPSSASRRKFTSLNMSNAPDEDDEIERLRSMAAKLRADASALEAEKQQKLAEVAEKAFREFDLNSDGAISVQELKAGLEKTLKVELSDKRVEELMKEFDDSGDGALQLDEFVGVDQFRNRLEALSREEKRLASEAKKMAQEEAQLAAVAQAKMEILNDGKPTNSDKLFSVLPYLFPLMDGLQYGRFLLSADGAESNPFVVILAVLYALYRTIPLSGFIAFFVLNFLGGNPSINRLVRYNMQQAIFIDIALFFPGLFSALVGFIAGGSNVALPAAITQFSTDAIFVTLLLTLGYCTVSSLLGITPDKIPIISPAVDDRMPTVDMFDIDPEGNVFAKRREEEENDDKKD